MFPEKIVSYNLRRKFLLELPEAHSVTYGTNSLHYKACLIWNSLPNDIVNSDSLNSFKLKIKEWKCDTCSCICCI